MLNAFFVVCGYLSGYWARSLAGAGDEVKDALVDYHHTIGTLLLFLAIPCPGLAWLMDRAKFGTVLFRCFYLVLLIATFACTIYAGYLGGKMVFEHAVGVSAQA